MFNGETRSIYLPSSAGRSLSQVQPTAGFCNHFYGYVYSYFPTATSELSGHDRDLMAHQAESPSYWALLTPNVNPALEEKQEGFGGRITLRKTPTSESVSLSAKIRTSFIKSFFHLTNIY